MMLAESFISEVFSGLEARGAHRGNHSENGAVDEGAEEGAQDNDGGEVEREYAERLPCSAEVD